LTVLFITKLHGSRPRLFLYEFAAVVSLVGINIHLGATLYLSRLIIIFYLTLILINAVLDRKNTWPQRFLLPYLKIFGLILCIQLISTLLSDHVGDGVRQVLIQASMMAIFIIVVTVSTSINIIIRALKIYLAVGLIQSLYGMYQVIGGLRGWPTYQTLMNGIPTANDRTTDGFYYMAGFSRAIGFFSTDVNHFAGYMVGIILLGLTIYTYDRKSIIARSSILFGLISLTLSLSRSGIITFLFIGIPSLMILLGRVNKYSKRSNSSILFGIFKLTIFFFIFVIILLSFSDLDIQSTTKIMEARFADLFGAGQGGSTDSLDEHIHTRLLGLHAFLLNPVLGVGPGVNALGWFSNDLSAPWAGSHSHHINILGETGLLGALAEWTLMGLVVRQMWRGVTTKTSRNLMARTVLAGLLAIYIAILLGNFLYHYYLSDFVWFIMASGVALSRLIVDEADVAKASDFDPLGNSGPCQGGNKS
jgi:hypothetical protein